MAHRPFWPTKYFFYPIGNTSALSWTRDLSPEEPARILSLGCGDPRSILYTIFSEPHQSQRSLDFTCCDFDPGILARNVLLFSLIADQELSSITIWNIFFHIYLDKGSHNALIEQCKKLVSHSETIQKWKVSPYGTYIKMCTEYTLVELRRHWTMYIEMHDLPAKRLKPILEAFKQQCKASSAKADVSALPAMRSSGPLIIHPNVHTVCKTQFRQYWKTGITSSNPKDVSAATLLNPTFVYSRGGEGCSVHYGTDPLAPFHLAAIFGNSRGQPSVSETIKGVQTQFNGWCSAFKNAINSSNIPIIRFFYGDAIPACQALRIFSTTGATKLDIPVANWTTQLINLNTDDYVQGNAPSIFNVIDTSNLSDHIGLLNVLISAIPLLEVSLQSSVLYTESLIYHGVDATKEFVKRLYADVTVISLLLGVCPVDYLSGFTTRSNTHELMLLQSVKGAAPQFHQVTTWKRPDSGDSVIAQAGRPIRPPAFDPYQLGTFLYDFYHRLFELEDSPNFYKSNQANLEKAVAMSNIVYYVREGFVLFAKLVRDKNQIPEDDWNQVMDRFFTIHAADKSLAMDTLAYHDLCAHLHRQGLYTDRLYHMRLPKIDRLSHWDSIPPLVRVILVVPRSKLAILDRPDATPTPTLLCHITGTTTMNSFTSIHVAFGRVIPMGTKSKPWIIFEPDPQGKQGSMPLVVSFTMPTCVLTHLEPMTRLNVSIGVRSTPATVPLIRELGLSLQLFSAPLLDDESVHVLPEQPLPSRKPQTTSAPPSDHIPPIGKASTATLELDEECEVAVSLTTRLSVSNEEAKTVFQSGVVPDIIQISPCVMRLTLGNRIQDVFFPFPIVGSQNRLRLARKSLYIEVIVPVSAPFKDEGMKINLFPVVGLKQAINPWSIHRLNLSALPVLGNSTKTTGQWLNPHFGSVMSSRERSLRKKEADDVLMNVKDTIHSILVRCSGIQQGPAKRLFALSNKLTNNCDTIIFINDIRFDLHSHTMVCNGYVLPLTRSFLASMQKPFSELILKGGPIYVPIIEGEVRAWKSLLPALVERCRSSWTHGPNCEYVAQGKIPLTDVMEVDPLCRCGRGKDTEDMLKVDLWSKFARHATRFALSPLFAVSYLESVGRDPERYRCSVCRGKGKPKLLKCSTCQKTRYCSKECQRNDWKTHKTRCN